MQNRLLHGIFLGLGTSVLALALWFAGLLDWMEAPSWDWRVRCFGNAGANTGQIKLILLDQASLDWGEQTQHWSWPWPRTAFAAILDFCRRGGAKAVIFDVLFTEPSQWGVSDDETLGAAIRKSPNAVMSLMLSTNQSETGRSLSESVFQMPSEINTYLNGADSREIIMNSIATPISEVATNTRHFGDVSASASDDKVIRRTPVFRLCDTTFVPSLGLAAYCAANPGICMRFAEASLHVGKTAIPLDSQGRCIPRYRGKAEPFQIISVQSVIQSEQRLREGEAPVIRPELFTSSYVFFAFSAPGLLDLRATPFDSVVPGVVIHASVLDNILSNDFLRDAPSWFTVILVFIMAILAASAGRFCRKAWQAVTVFSIFLIVPFAASFRAYPAGYWLPLAPVETAVALALVGAVVVNYSIEGRQKRFIKSAFKQYLSPAVIERILEQPERLKLGGELRELTIFFSDVRGFTGISESLSPDRLTALLNEYLTAMSDIIMEQAGTIDKYEGDAIIAFWNAPLDLPDHAACGVRATLLCQQRLAEMRPDLMARYGKEIVARIGMNTGPVVVGNMGSHQRFNYTFLGDAGNLASRLEGVNKQFGTFILISENTAKLLDGAIPLREVGKVRVVGKKDAVRVFEPMLPEAAAVRADILKRFASGLESYYDGDFKHALEQFTGIAAGDAVAEAYAKRCRELLSIPPAGDWDGVWEMTEK